MAEVKISALPAATVAGATDMIPIVQGGTTKQLNYNTLVTAGINAKAGMEVYEDFSTYPDGPMPATTSDGRPWSLAIGSATTPGAVPIISNGALTYPNTDYGGVYAILKLDGDVIRAGAEFSFSAHTATGGELAIAIMNQDIGQSYANGTGIPQAAMHLQVRPMLIDYDVNAVANTPVESVSSINYNADGSDWTVADKRYFVDVYLDKPNNTAYIRTPQGLTYTATDPMIGATGHKYVFFEPYRNASDATTAQTQTLASFHKVWADSHVAAVGSELVVTNEKRPRAAVVALNTTTGGDQTMTTTATKIRTMTVSLPAPPSMMFDVEISVPVVTTAVGQVRIGVMNEAGTTWATEALSDGSTPSAWQMVCTGSQLVDTTYSVRFRITFTGKAVGNTCVIPAGVQTTGTGAVKFGANISPRMRVTQVPLV